MDTPTRGVGFNLGEFGQSVVSGYSLDDDILEHTRQDSIINTSTDILHNLPYLHHGFGLLQNNNTHSSEMATNPLHFTQSQFEYVSIQDSLLNPFSQYLSTPTSQFAFQNISSFPSTFSNVSQQIFPFSNPNDNESNAIKLIPKASNFDASSFKVEGLEMGSKTVEEHCKPNKETFEPAGLQNYTYLTSSTSLSSTSISNHGNTNSNVATGLGKQFGNEVIKDRHLNVTVELNDLKIAQIEYLDNCVPCQDCEWDKKNIDENSNDCNDHIIAKKCRTDTCIKESFDLNEHSRNIASINIIKIANREQVPTELKKLNDDQKENHGNIVKNKKCNDVIQEDSNQTSVLINKTDCNDGKHRQLRNEKICFYLKGRLGHDIDKMKKCIEEILIEPVDREEKFYDNLFHNYSSSEVPKTVHTNITKEILPIDVKKTYIESINIADNPQPLKTEDDISIANSQNIEHSLADIRAGIIEPNHLVTAELSNLQSELDENNADELISNEDSNYGIDESNYQENWYSAAMKKYAELAQDTDIVEFSPTAKRGGRSDPDNPFALTSPSFSESAAKALMTTTQSGTATVVTISIMSIGSRIKLIPKIINSKAAEGGIVSILNPVEDDAVHEPTSGNTGKDGDITLSSSMSKALGRGSDAKDADTEIDRLDVNITIDDDQYAGDGDEKRWQCKICSKSYTTKHNLVAHILDHSGIKPHLCLVCGKYFKQLSHLNTHMLTHDNVKPHKCSVCNKGFTQISHLKRHETVHMGSKPYICDICNRGFAYPSELRIHKDKHVPGKEKCTECEKEFETQAELQNHMLTNNHSRELTCKHCGKLFRFPSQLRDHMLTHVGTRPFICSECGMDFKKEHHLKAHQFTHTGLRPYACLLCGRSFNQKANMQRHMLIHNAERAYMCEMCNKTFTQPQTLKAHMVVHSAKKPYSCKICSKQFGRLHNLQGHMHIHGDSKPYVCSICQSSFTLKGNLNRHKKVKHNCDGSAENMEEDAVNILNSLSDRAHGSDLDNDLDSRDSLVSPDSKSSSKKGRKSIPKKHVSRQLYSEEDNEAENINDLDNENIISYSDEERENDRIMGSSSECFKSIGKISETKSRRKRQEVNFRVENVEDDDNVYENDAFSVDDTTEDDIDNNIQKPNCQSPAPSRGTVNTLRPVRKRKNNDSSENETKDTEKEQQMVKSKRRKCDKLDNIIAKKFNL